MQATFELWKSSPFLPITSHSILLIRTMASLSTPQNGAQIKAARARGASHIVSIFWHLYSLRPISHILSACADYISTLSILHPANHILSLSSTSTPFSIVTACSPFELLPSAFSLPFPLITDFIFLINVRSLASFLPYPRLEPFLLLIPSPF